MPAHATELSRDYRRIEEAIRFLDDRLTSQPPLEAVAAHVGLSKFHFHRLFRRWAGVSPKQFLEYLTVDYAKELLRGRESVLGAAYEAGLSGPGRLHDQFVAVDAVTPGEWKAQGEGVEIRYGFHPTPFGEALLATTRRGICALEFVGEGESEAAAAGLAERWPKARLVEDREGTRAPVEAIFGGPGARRHPLQVLLQGTNFQVKVWAALLAVPDGAAVTYGELATAVGRPGAVRAVAGAVAANPVAFLIPCHRVLRKVGGFGGYRWGSERKRAILAWEAAHRVAAGGRPA